MSNQPHQSSLDSRRTWPLSPRSRRLSRFLALSALALMVGVLSACGSSDSGEDVEREAPPVSDSGEDVEREAAAGTEKCDAPPAPRVDWSGCDKYLANLYRDDLTGARLLGAKCGVVTTWPDGTKGHGTTCPPTN